MKTVVTIDYGCADGRFQCPRGGTIQNSRSVFSSETEVTYSIKSWKTHRFSSAEAQEVVGL
jgi:hypothetical protein